jgi:hypothetical protein
MNKLRHLSLLCATALALTAASYGIASSETKNPLPSGASGSVAGAPAGAPNIMAPAVATVDGFRSAKFGMTDTEVKAAIVKDFKVKPDAISEQPNPGERTTVVTAKIPDVLPGGGVAEVSYVFGYESKKLIQVSIAWSKAIDDKMTPEQLFSNSSVLRSHFLGEGFKPESIASNMPINDGILAFRGSDESDHSVILILHGTMSDGNSGQKILTPTSLLLFYIANAKTPDIYRLPPGSF